MRNIFALSILLTGLLLDTLAQDSLLFTSSKPGARILNMQSTSVGHGSGTILRIRCGSTLINEKPLFVLDGVVVNEVDLKNINPNDIEKIGILKGREATAIYGTRASSGVVLITTKRASERTIFVRDFLSNPLQGSTVEIISGAVKKDTLRFAADAYGRIITDKMSNDNEYEIRVTSIGYKTYRECVNSKYLAKEFTIWLDKDIKTLSEVVVVSSPPIFCRRICCGIRVTRYIRDTSISSSAVNSLKIYPNPAKAGTEIKVESKLIESDECIIQLFNLQGQIMNSVATESKFGNRVITYHLPHVNAGSYILRITSKKSGRQQAEKIIIQ